MTGHKQIATYREHLRQMCDWESFLLAESGLPGAGANWALAQAAADEGDAAQFGRWLAVGPGEGPEDTPGEFLPVCGALGYGRLLAEGERTALAAVRRAANDPRRRVREAAALALRRWGAADGPALLAEAGRWAAGTRAEQRAIVVALDEPGLAGDAVVLDVLDRVTATLVGAADRGEAGFVALCAALAESWRAAVAAAPERGGALVAQWLAVDDPDVREVMRASTPEGRRLGSAGDSDAG